jgi:kynurenine--oxoglutarate transaminase/cysteine-S-conjugate beta-lyase/glutamine--phenylpyruvate transaminase
MSDRINVFPNENIWTEYTRLSNEHKSVNLGQGFPDWKAPQFIIDATVDAVQNGPLTYARPGGDMDLVNAVSKFYAPLLKRDRIDPLNEVLITNGASGAIYQIMQAILNPGDEVICFEPYFNQYDEWILMASGKTVLVPLETIPNTTTSSSRWKLNESTLRSAITKKTKMILVNTPVNPTGKVFDKSELEIIAKIAIEHDLLVISDEVYEFLIFGDVPHQRIATFPEMWKRTFTVSSCAKTFSVTGFKVGWIIGPKELVLLPFKVMQCSTFCVCTPVQKGIAYTLPNSDKYLSELSDFFKTKCDKLCDVFENVFGKSKVIRPQGGYFIIVDISQVSKLVEFNGDLEKDDQICRWMIKNIGVTSLPLTAFMKSKITDGNQYARFCFAKKDETLDDATDRLLKLKVLMK